MGVDSVETILQKWFTSSPTANNHWESSRKTIGKAGVIITIGIGVLIVFDVCVYHSGGVLEDEEFR